jgi:ABC-type transport system involved in cytochrome bd biosynthesis fused ATPase/permease subunit
MLFVVVEGVFVYSRNRSGLALSVLSGFILILVAHVLLFVSGIYLSADIYLLGTFVQFMGFCALLYFLYRSSHVGTI